MKQSIPLKISTKTGSTLPPFQIELDWYAYWLEFMDLHGDDPVEYKGVYLFQDGWTHSKADYAGPEWPPPADPIDLRNLQGAYWEIRKGIVTSEQFALSQKLVELRGMQLRMSAPLQMVVKFTDSEGKLVREVKQLDLAGLEDRIAWLRTDAEQCDEKLEELSDEPVSAGGVSQVSEVVGQV